MAKTKAFKITQNNQYIQEISLNAGEYTFSANIRADSASITVCKFSLLVGGVWIEYDLTDQIYIGQFQKVKKVIQINDKATKFSLISSGSGGGRIFHVDRPMFEEGSNAGTPKPNEMDIEEQAEASNVKVTIGIPYYEFRKDADGGTVQETLTIPFHIFKGNVKVNVPSANIGVLYKPSNIMVVDVSNAFNSIYVIPLKEFTASEGRVVFSIPVDGRNYEAEFQFKVKEVKDGKSPYIGENGNWYVWDSAQGKYVDSGDPAHGDDGKSPEIRNGYWWVWENGQWSNTGIKAEGENAKWIKLIATATQIKVKQSGSTPSSISVVAQLFNMTGNVAWSWSVNGGAYSTSNRPSYITINNNVATINSASATFDVLSLKATKEGQEDSVSIARVSDGERGLPGKLPVTKTYRKDETYYNNDTVVHFVYYRATNTWWKLKDGVEEYTATSASPNTTYFEQLSSVDVMVAETIIAENANIAGFIFREELLVSQMGRNTAGDDLSLGNYMQFQFAQGAHLTIAPTTGWADTPPTSNVTYLWMRMKLKSNTGWMINYRISGSNPHVGVRFGATKDGTFYNIPYQSGRNWMEVTYDAGTQNEQVKIYPITEELAISDFKPNLQLDGRNGYIYATRGEFEGKVTATSGKIGGFNIEEDKLTTTGAGISGIQGDGEKPAFWAGGTYDMAKDNTAKAIIRHDGSGHLASGNISWGEDGNVVMNGIEATNAIFSGLVNVPFESGNYGYTLIPRKLRSYIFTNNDDLTVWYLPVDNALNGARIMLINWRINKKTLRLSTGRFFGEWYNDDTKRYDIPANSFCEMVGFSLGTTFQGWLITNSGTII